jgi:hypothetical protein
MTKKQIRSTISARKRALKAHRAREMKFFLTLMLIIGSLGALGVITSPLDAQASTGMLVGSTFCSLMAIGNIKDVPDSEVAGEAIAYKVWLVCLNQIDDTVDFPSPNSEREVGTLPLLNGERMHYFEAHDIPTYTSQGERGDLTIAGTNTFTIIMGGVRNQLLDFIEQYAGLKFIVIFQECESPYKYVMGNPCKPMLLKSYNLKNDKESRSVTFVFESKSINQYNHYIGDIILQSPAVHQAGATTLALSPGAATCEIPGGTSSPYDISGVSGLTATDKGRVVTLVGTGSANAATIADGGAFILEDGATWTARAGSRISFRVLDPSTLVEIGGTRVQTA